MYIGHLHSCWQDNRVLNYFDAILIRTDFETWDYCKKHNIDFLNCFYGQYSQRAKLRELIYPNIKYKHWITIASQYSFVFLSANADMYPNSQDFVTYVKEMVNLFKPDVIGAMNECFEKRGSAEKVMETAIDVYYGARNAGILEPKICIYNQKIKTQEEQKCVKQILNDDFIQNYVNYFGYQSLETSPAKLKEYIPLIKEKDFEPIDVEIGTTTESYNEIKNLFDINRTFGVDKVFILTPYISKDLANYDENFKKYALSFNGIYKDKFRLIEYVQQFKTKEKGIMIADEYKRGDKNDKVIDWIQDQLYHRGFLAHPIDFGNFDEKTEQAVKDWQATQPKIAISGIITKYHIFVLVEQSDDSTKIFRQLMIYAS